MFSSTYIPNMKAFPFFIPEKKRQIGFQTKISVTHRFHCFTSCQPCPFYRGIIVCVQQRQLSQLQLVASLAEGLQVHCHYTFHFVILSTVFYTVRLNLTEKNLLVRSCILDSCSLAHIPAFFFLHLHRPERHPVLHPHPFCKSATFVRMLLR